MIDQTEAMTTIDVVLMSVVVVLKTQSLRRICSGYCTSAQTKKSGRYYHFIDMQEAIHREEVMRQFELNAIMRKPKLLRYLNLVYDT